MIARVCVAALAIATSACESSDVTTTCNTTECTSGDASQRACAPSANFGSPCDPQNDQPCMGCTVQAGNYTCMCRSSPVLPDASGPQWECIGTGEACTGNTSP